MKLAWPLTILGWGALTALLSLGDVHSPVRAVVVISFLLVCPGMAWARLIPLRDDLATLTVALGLSIALDGAVAAIVLYARAWSPTAILLIVLGLSAAGAAVQLARPPAGGPFPGRSFQSEEITAYTEDTR
jgi:uncharacterized membrane protein